MKNFEAKGKPMKRLLSPAICCAMFCGLLLVAGPTEAKAQVAVSSFSAGQPVITYLPERRGLFGQRLVYRPVVGFVAPAAPLVTTFQSPVVTQRVVIAEPAMSTFQSPVMTQRVVTAAPVVTTFQQPVMTHRVVTAAPVITTFQQPVMTQRVMTAAPVITTFQQPVMVPAPVTPYFPPMIGY